MSIQDKIKAVKEAIGHIEKQFGKGAIMSLGQQRDRVEVPAISTGCPSLDQALGCGGYPRGRIVEIYGPESSGKTTLTLHAIAETQRAGGVAAFIDAEHALDVSYAQKVGVNVEELLVSQPDTGEQALDILETLVRSGAFALVVIDSVAALVPKAEIEGEMGDSHVGLQARLMSQALRKVTGLTHRQDTTVMFINQLRMKIGVTFGSPETTTGGHALKYYASVRLDIRRIGQVKVGDAVIGNRTRVKVVKNKLSPPFKTTEFDIRYGEGIDALGDLLDTAVELGVVRKNGAYYALDNETLAQGREKTRELLHANPPLIERLQKELQARKAATADPNGKQEKAATIAAQGSPPSRHSGGKTDKTDKESLNVETPDQAQPHQEQPMKAASGDDRHGKGSDGPRAPDARQGTADAVEHGIADNGAKAQVAQETRAAGKNGANKTANKTTNKTASKSANKGRAA